MPKTKSPQKSAIGQFATKMLGRDESKFSFANKMINEEN